MQNGNPQKHMTGFGYQIFGFEVEGQEHIVETSLWEPKALSFNNQFSDLLVLIVSNN